MGVLLNRAREISGVIKTTMVYAHVSPEYLAIEIESQNLGKEQTQLKLGDAELRVLVSSALAS